MGVLQDIGIVTNGKPSATAFSGFISDVKKRISTGRGIFRSPLVGTIADPIKNFELLPLENQFLFPEFHRIWKERYEKTVKQLDLPSSFQHTAKCPPVAIIDPSAISKALDLKTKPSKFPDILYEIQGLPPPGTIEPPATIKDVMANVQPNTLKFFAKYLKDIDPVSEPQKLKKIIDLILTPPVPAAAQFSNPKLTRFGYLEQHSFENAVYLAQRKAHAELMSRAAGDPTFIPLLIAQMSSGQNDLILTEVYAIAKKHQPTPMSTSVFEMAAQEILLQHQVKMQCIALLGQNIGSGDILQAMAATPEDQGGIGLIDTSKTEQQQTQGNEKISNETSTSPAEINSQEQQTPTLSGQQPPQNDETETSGISNDPFSQGQQVQDEPPPEGGGEAGPAEQIFGYQGGSTLQDEEYSYPQQEDNQSQQPVGFGVPPDEIPPNEKEGQSDVASGQQGSGGSAEPSETFGYNAPADEAPPTEEVGGGTTQGGSNVSPFDQPPADDYPPEGGSQGQQTAPPGFGDYPTDEGSEPQTQPTVYYTEESGEELGASNNVKPGSSSNKDYDPVDVSDHDASNMKYIPQSGATTYGAPEPPPGDDGDDIWDGGETAPKKKKSKGGGTALRKRARDIIEGGETCQGFSVAEGGVGGGALGPPPDWANMQVGSGTTLIGADQSSGRPEWLKVIPGCNSSPIGQGYSPSNLKAAVPNEANKTQKYATSCGHMVGYVIHNTCFSGGEKLTINKTDVTQKMMNENGLAINVSSDLAGVSTIEVGHAMGFVIHPVYAAYFGAYINCRNNPDVSPKYGDCMVTTEGSGMMRHVGVIVEWHPEEGWLGSADAGQGGMPGAQGMRYMKRHCVWTPGKGYYVSGEAGQSGGKTYVAGWIDIELLAKGMASNEKYASKYVSLGIPSWVK